MSLCYTNANNVYSNINSIWQMLATLNSICRYQVLKKHTAVKKNYREVFNKQFYDDNDFVWCENIIWRYNDL